MTNNSIECPICTRLTPAQYQEKHHFYPKQNRRKEKTNETILVCCSCGDQLHKLFTNKELRKKYNNLKALLEDSRIQKWIEWIKKKPNDFSICMSTKKRR